MLSTDEEERNYHAQVQELKVLWSNPRWRYTKRPFTAEQIVSKRGNLRIEYPGNIQSKKLWRILEERFRVRNSPSIIQYYLLTIWKNRDASYTYGCLDAVMVTQMAKYLDTVYVSGWQCSSTASSTNEPGPDLADYPMVKNLLMSTRPEDCLCMLMDFGTWHRLQYRIRSTSFSLLNCFMIASSGRKGFKYRKRSVGSYNIRTF